MGGQCRNYLWFIFELYFYFNIVSWWMFTGTVHIFHGWAMPELFMIYLWIIFLFQHRFLMNVYGTGTVHIFHGWAMPELEDPVRYRNKSISNWERGVSYGTFWPKAKASFLKPINYAFLCFPARSKGLHTCVWRSLDSERIDLQFDAYKRTIRLLYEEIRESTVQHDWSLEREREISSQIHCPWLGG
jgi:hypothetical protein